MNLESIQCELQRAGLDGWLFFDHHERDPLAYRVLGLKPPGHISRRWYYFIPAQGEPRGLVHQVEPHVLHPLPGAKIPYARWQEQEAGLRTLLQDASKVAMQYSPRCAVPYVANVDAGTVEWIRGLGVEVVSYDITWMAYCGEEVPAPMREAFAAVAAEDLSASNQPTQNVEVDPTLLTRYLNEHLPVNPVRVVFESRKLSDSK